MITLVYGADAQVAQWVAAHIRHVDNFDKVTAIGIAEDGKLIAGVVYHRFAQENIEMSIAATTPRWIGKGRLHALFYYPFAQLGCTRVTAQTPRGNKRARRMLEGLGFKLEGVMREAYPHQKDAFIYGLLKRECRWIDNG